ncbi:MAG: hypothetical protein JNL70_27650 [Saprospiraceae bacterium]|nr:hypothetical protein [Saprospiraceae bacterium]
MKQLLTFTAIIFLGMIPISSVSAQTPTDHLMMPKGTLCNFLGYSTSRWDNYWEGANKRINENIGTFKTENILFMAALGVTDKLNVMVGLPYVKTSSSASYLAGQQGIQDFSVWLKYNLIEKKGDFGTIKAFVTVGGSLPATNYNTDFLPFSIGLKAKTASGRLILSYANKGFYATVQGGATLRSNVEIDRNSFIFNNKLYESNIMPVPNAADGSLTLGFANTRFQTAVSLDRFGCLSGDDIRYNDMPILTNKMEQTSVNWFGRVNLGHLSVIVNAGKVLNGRNVGEATSLGGSVLYWVQIFNKAKKADK